MTDMDKSNSTTELPKYISFLKASVNARYKDMLKPLTMNQHEALKDLLKNRSMPEYGG